MPFFFNATADYPMACLPTCHGPDGHSCASGWALRAARCGFSLRALSGRGVWLRPCTEAISTSREDQLPSSGRIDPTITTASTKTRSRGSGSSIRHALLKDFEPVHDHVELADRLVEVMNLNEKPFPVRAHVVIGIPTHNVPRH